MKHANLHLHSTFSDAELTPRQLVRIGKSLGYRALALTDHETDGGCKEFIYHARKEGLNAISGIEFYGYQEGTKLHLTALDFDMDDPGLRAFVKLRCDLRNECTRKCIERGIELGYVQGFTWDDILEYAPEGYWICINTVMEVMKFKKLVPYDYDWTDFRMKIFNAPEAKAFRPAPPTAEEVIKIVRQAGGVIALAHPNEIWLSYLDKLVDYGLNGIEISHPNIQPHIPYLASEAADKYNLYRCGGTDHDGAMSGNGGNRAQPVLSGITEEEYTTLIERRLGR